MGLALAILNRERYRELGRRLRDAGFEPAVNDQGNKRLQTWTAGTPHPVTVDLLIPPVEERDKGGELRHFESDLAAIITPGLELAFKDRRGKELSGRLSSGAWATRKIPVCGPGAFTVLKALAFGNRAENNDAYIEDALAVIERDFCHHDGPGPIGTARFIARELDENIQADVVGYARALLRSMGR